jgi:hypothetical protein
VEGKEKTYVTTSSSWLSDRRKLCWIFSVDCEHGQGIGAGIHGEETVAHHSDGALTCQTIGCNGRICLCIDKNSALASGGDDRALCQSTIFLDRQHDD